MRITENTIPIEVAETWSFTRTDQKKLEAFLSNKRLYKPTDSFTIKADRHGLSLLLKNKYFDDEVCELFRSSNDIFIIKYIQYLKLSDTPGRVKCDQDPKKPLIENKFVEMFAKSMSSLLRNTIINFICKYAFTYSQASLLQAHAKLKQSEVDFVTFTFNNMRYYEFNRRN